MGNILEGTAQSLLALLAVFAAAFAMGAAAGRFSRLPGKEQAAKVKAWLLWAVTSAEREMDGASGKLKLRRVYDLFVQRFPEVAMAVPFETFCGWVDEALQEAEDSLLDAGPAGKLKTADKRKGGGAA